MGYDFCLNIWMALKTPAFCSLSIVWKTHSTPICGFQNFYFLNYHAVKVTFWGVYSSRILTHVKTYAATITIRIQNSCITPKHLSCHTFPPFLPLGSDWSVLHLFFFPAESCHMGPLRLLSFPAIVSLRPIQVFVCIYTALFLWSKNIIILLSSAMHWIVSPSIKKKKKIVAIQFPCTAECHLFGSKITADVIC